MKCNFCLENEAILNLDDKYPITYIGDNTFNEKAWACEDCHQKFRNQKYLDSKKGFRISYP